ncbi:MAG TPA: sulfate permease [Pusillimonas sp.]|uniref:SulP family inorganic anion transporter n=1 Tax=Pusillimonas sp. TaxID=3040095 RepID=UPI002B91E628|nr:sulfate permease [Pusillimonas sp.]HUH86628.1 sulfate permease [Pusillimonas sp.]
MLNAYRLEWLRSDITAGLALSAFLVPVGIAYAVAAGLPGIYGLYATIVPLCAYAVFGPSRVLVLGPDSALAAIILSVVVPLSAGDPARAVALAGAMAVVTGATCLLAGVLRLGFVTELLSKPIRYGYMNGIALTVLISQLPNLFGFSTEGEHPLVRAWSFLQGVVQGQTNPYALGLGIAVFIVLLLLRARKRVPAVLIAVVLTILITMGFNLEARGVSILGGLPQGLPAPVWPAITYADLGPVIIGGVTAAILAFSETSVLSRSYAARMGDHVDPNQEILGLGAANLATGLFQGFPVSSSASRTPVAEAAGAKTQLASLVGALVVALMLVLTPNLLHSLPSSALAAVVIAAVISLFEIKDLGRIFRIQQWEFWLSVSCAAGVLLLGAIPGIGLAIIIAVIEFLWDGWRPHHTVLGRVDGLKGYHDLSRYPDARRVPGLVLFRWDAPLFFANAEFFQQAVLEAVDASPTPVRWLVVAAEPVTSVDVTAGDMLKELDERLKQQGIKFCFAEMKDPVKDKLKRFGLYSYFGDDYFFPTVGRAVSQYVDTFSVSWQDWEDSPGLPAS